MPKKVALNFGCGSDIKIEDEKFIWENVDMQSSDKLTHVFDFDDLPYKKLKDNRYDFVLMSHILGHLLYPDRAMYEIWKKCKHGATIRILIGHYTNKGAYQDLRHKTFFCKETFIHFAKTKQYLNKNPRFKIKKLYTTPTVVGKFIPTKLREFMSLFFGGLTSLIVCEYEVNKKNSEKEYVWE